MYDANGTEVFALLGLDSSFNKSFQEVSFGKSKNTTIQVYFVSNCSYVKLDYATLKQGLGSGKEYEQLK